MSSTNHDSDPPGDKNGKHSQHVTESPPKNDPEGNVAELDTRSLLSFGYGKTNTRTESSTERRRDVSGKSDEVFQFKELLDELADLQLSTYKMNHAKRGIAVIFNNETFDWSTRMNRRVGTQKDVENLQNYLGLLGFEVNVLQDRSTDEIKHTLYQVSKLDHSDSDCFLCAFLTHGDDGVIYGRDGTTELQELFDLFRGEKCPSLVGKPKVFFIQACRGEQHEVGVIEADSGDQTDSRGSVTTISQGSIPTIPAGADFLLSYSTTQGYYSHRDTAFGSWYIQALSKVLETHATTLEFTQILTLVNQLVAKRAVERCLDPRMIGKKQIPCFVSMLTKRLIFTPKKK
uniref:Caspase-6 n=2 Tax=Stichopus japonicus TaxID=307972 RepID=A0A1C9UNC6_STIJA|nr:caspase-6 [Apostichopus japonicus]